MKENLRCETQGKQEQQPQPQIIKLLREEHTHTNMQVYSQTSHTVKQDTEGLWIAAKSSSCERFPAVTNIVFPPTSSCEGSLCASSL